MKKIGEFISGLLVILVYIFMVYGEVFGIVHSVRKHSSGDVIASILIPPWAWYRSIEMFWHDDFRGVNWDKRLSNDMHVCAVFLIQADNGDVNQDQLNNDLESFSTKISKYPADKRQFLIDGARKFIELTISFENDVRNSIQDYKLTGGYELKKSDKTLKLEEEISKSKLKEEIELDNKMLVELNDLLKNKFSLDNGPLDPEYFDKFNSSFKQHFEAQQREFKRIFKVVFNEEFSFDNN
jgi:hypothetical protein